MRILLVGCGKMGGALLDGWLDTGTSPEDIRIVDPAPAYIPEPESGMSVLAGPDKLAGFEPDVIVFAVKPQVISDVAPAYAGRDGVLYLSIAAGTKIATLEKHLGDGAAVIRAMPNTPASVRRGITVLCANDLVTDDARNAAEDLLSAVGEVAWTNDENLMDAVTAVSGSGPAYIFLLAECMAEAGEKAGLPPDLAERLARATVTGAGELLDRAAETAEQLRVNVTSPGGTTEAALGVLMAEPGMRELLIEAIRRAADRSRELAG